MPNDKAKSIAQDFEFHNMLIHRFVDGITHEESVLQLPFEHNCMNWIFGHIVANRSHVLETVGVAHTWREEVRALYHTGTAPITPESPSIRLEKLVAYLDEALHLLKTALVAVSAMYLDEPHSNYRGEKTRFEHLTGFHWHESFHVGQLEILRAFIEARRGSRVGQIVWQDLTVKAAGPIKDFYIRVVGWEARPHDMGAYHDFDLLPPGAQRPVTGICHARGANADLPPAWLVYISVADIEESAKRCRELGGKVIDGPRRMGTSQFCVIQDPAGAYSALISS
jgi:predicted enzyme related to lactoylglutathione lyase